MAAEELSAKKEGVSGSTRKWSKDRRIPESGSQSYGNRNSARNHGKKPERETRFGKSTSSNRKLNNGEKPSKRKSLYRYENGQ